MLVAASEMAQQAKPLATKPDNMSWILTAHMMEGENRFPQTVLCPPHLWHSMQTAADVCTQNRVFKLKIQKAGDSWGGKGQLT